MANPMHPSPVEKELYSYFAPNDRLIIFDVGSCDAQASILYGQLFPNALIYAFEPISKNYKIIQENLKAASAKNITAYQLAMSDQQGVAEMFVSQEITTEDPRNSVSQSSSLLAPDKHLQLYPDCKFERKESVKTETLKKFCLRHNISRIDFLHLDVQGAELMVLKGAEEFIGKFKMVWLEIEHVSLYKDQPLREEVENFMHDHGYILSKFRVGGYSGDQLYVREDFAREKRGEKALFYMRLKDLMLRNYFVVRASKIARKIRFAFLKSQKK